MTKPIEVSLDQVMDWADENDYSKVSLGYDYELAIARRAAQWGADQELEACCELLDINGCASKWIDMLRATRRPKPPSLKEEALADLDVVIDRLLECGRTVPLSIRRALESIPG